MTYMLLLNCALKLVEEIILYYDARSKKHQMYSIIAVTNKHTAKLHHVGSLYIYIYIQNISLILIFCGRKNFLLLMTSVVRMLWKIFGRDKKEARGDWRKLRTGMLYDLYFVVNIILLMKKRKIM